jgi:hypothetical protein
MNRLKQICDKLKALRHLDSACLVHGASTHRYALSPVLPETEVAAFERAFGVALPGEFAAFLTQVGNGGAGPGYGLYPLAKAVEAFRLQQAWAEQKGRPLPRLDRPFPLTAAVADGLIACRRTIPFRGNFQPHVATALRLDGIMDICHHGCTAYEGLVLCGEQRGRVWGSGGPGYRWSANGPGPGSLDFLSWYEQWLDGALAPEAVERRTRQAEANGGD